MRLIKIYDHSFVPLTAFIDGEFGDLEFSKSVADVGSASFVLDINSDKVSEINLRNYNRVEIYEDGVISWIGYISTKNIQLNVVRIRCKGLLGILKKRQAGSSFVASGQAGSVIQSLLASVNAADDTGIQWGGSDITTSVNLTFTNSDVLSAISKIADAVNGQYYVGNDRKFYLMSSIGNDLSASVVLKYNQNQIAQSNLLSFDVDDDGDDIQSKTYGKSNTLSSTQEDSALKTKFGLLEGFKDFRVANTQGDLNSLTANENLDTQFSPKLSLSPTVVDNFYIGDIVKVKILNKLVNIDGDYQILEKSVKYSGNQKLITVKINALSRDIIDKVKDINDRLKLLETKV